MTENTAPRWCFYVDETMVTPDGVIPSVVTEGEPGHAPMMGQGEHSSPWYWGDLETAKQIAADENAKRGLTPEDCNEILASSIGAQIRSDSQQAELADRYDELRRGGPLPRSQRRSI